MTLEKAIEIATKAHRGQKDKFGQPYIHHVMRVMCMGRTEDEKILGVLHDVVEDSVYTFEDLENAGLAAHIVDALKCVTKETEDEDYDHFTNRVLTNKLACMVKLNDLNDNMDIKRIPELTEKDIARLNKYLRAYRKISKVIFE